MKTVAEILRAKPQAAVYSVTPSTSVLIGLANEAQQPIRRLPASRSFLNWLGKGR